MANQYKTIGWLPNTADFVRPSKPAVTPQYFGAVADGVTDDSAAIQAAVDSGNSVHFPGGTYLVEDTITYSDLKSRSFSSNGNAIFKLADSRPLGTPIFSVLNCTKIIFDNLKFDGNKANQTQPPDDGAWNSGAPRIYFTPIDIDNSTHTWVTNCEFYDVCTVSLNIKRSQYIVARTNNFHDSYMDAIFSNEHASEEENKYIWLQDNTITNMTYRDGGGDIIDRYGNGILVNASYLYVTDNTINGVDRTGMKPTDVDGVHDIYVANNTITNADWQGINPQGGHDIIIENNTITGSGWNGVLLSSAPGNSALENISIFNNEITNSGLRDTGDAAGTTDGILITGSSNNVAINDNTIDLTGRFGMYFYDGKNISTENNTIRNTANTAIYLSGDGLPDGDYCENVTFNGDKIYCDSNVNEGIAVLDYSENIEFIGVEIYDPINYGILLVSPDGVLVDRCLVDNSNNFGIRVASAQNTTIRNSVVANTRLDSIYIGETNPGTTPPPDTVLVESNVLRDGGRHGIHVGVNATNVTIGDNIYSNLGGSDVYYEIV